MSGKGDVKKASAILYVALVVYFLACVVLALWFLDSVSQAIYEPSVIYPFG
jgi:hypothetical protein